MRCRRDESPILGLENGERDIWQKVLRGKKLIVSLLMRRPERISNSYLWRFAVYLQSGMEGNVFDEDFGLG